jgi:hypothetical protein
MSRRWHRWLRWRMRSGVNEILPEQIVSSLQTQFKATLPCGSLHGPVSDSSCNVRAPSFLTSGPTSNKQPLVAHTFLALSPHIIAHVNMESRQFFVQLLSDYALLSVFAQCSTPKDFHCLTVSCRDLQEAVKRGATSAFYDLIFNGECSRAEPQSKQAQTWLGRNIVHAWNSQCGDTTERCSMCPNHICTVSHPANPFRHSLQQKFVQI